MPETTADRRRLLSATVALGGLTFLVGATAEAAETGLVTKRSSHSVPETITRFRNAVTGAGWVVFTEIDHAAAAAAVGLKLAPRTVVLFGNPKNGTAAMAAHPALALDLPMRALVWQDDSGAVFVTTSSGEDVATRVFARHGVTVPADGIRAMDAFFDKVTTAATS